MKLRHEYFEGSLLPSKKMKNYLTRLVVIANFSASAGSATPLNSSYWEKVYANN